MTAADANTRKAQERARKRAQGLSKLEIWADPRDHALIREFAIKAARKRQRETK